MKKLTLFLGVFMLSTLLSACSWLQPKHKTIEYDEEVKLHDGSMIWVHIKRHYVLSGGGALGDPGAFEMSYSPKEVEISWDTGFKGVGRKSVFFDNLSVIDKYHDKWYLFGGSSNPSNVLNNSINVSKVGTKVGQTAYLVVLDKKGEFIETSKESLSEIKQTNILNPIGINNWGMFPEPLENTKLTWSEKLKLQSSQSKRQRFIQNNFNSENVK